MLLFSPTDDFLFVNMKYYRDEEFLMKFGQHLRELRKERGFSQEDLANECELPPSQIGRMERGQLNTAISYLPLIARILNVSVLQLVDF
ncbi:helix-turn-helix transcriptional regulator [Chitinophaga polysaccharea]|uniref:helix-turn-helix domain-containing protein n=1 Tax=Chitinophaga polysaccharea TaxID=1293035 RepID=UPI001455B3DE|nr:helix-turn-helix transcriptional regulator [Chitinophaga polysaccharea]NLR58156.1 helix-turn-helix transcriptional regulator [Chitinophaga polysaccharea]